MQRILQAPNYASAVGKLRDFQVANQNNWDHYPDNDPGAASMNMVTQTASGKSTETRVNPLDPAQVEGSAGWNDPALSWDRVPQNSWRKY